MQKHVAALLLIFASSSTALGAQEKPTTSETKSVTPEIFLNLRYLQDPQFSPDGTRVAFVASDPLTGQKRTRHIWLFDKDGKTVRQLTFSAKEKSEISPRWSPDGRTLAFLSNRDGDEQQIYLLRMAGGEGVPLTKGKASVASFAWSPDGKSIAFLSPEPKTEAEEKRIKEKNDERVVDKDDKQPRLHVIELASKAERTLTPLTWKVEELTWMPNGQALVIKATAKPASDQFTDALYLVPLSGETKELRPARGPLGEIKVSPDGSLVAFQAARDDGPEPHDLWLLNPHGGLPRNLTGATLDRAVAQAEWGKDGSLYLVYEDGFHSKFGSFSAAAERRDIPDLPVNAGEFAVSSNGEIAFVGQTAVAPQELWLRDARGEAHQVTHLNDEIAKLPLIAPEFYKYKSFDGQEIEAALLRPAGYDGKSKLPTVILVHGGPTGNWRDSVEAWGQLLAARGYLVMYPNVRGSIGYGEKFVEMNRADWGGGDFKDVMKGVDDLVAKGFADPERLGIAGWSYGGYMAEWAVTQTDTFKAAVSGAGMADLISEYGTEIDPAYDEWFFGTPYEHPEHFLNSSPFIYMKNAKTPTLILQGEDDPIDPIGQSQELYRGLKRYGVDAELVLYPREPHGFREAKHRVDVENRLLAWFDKHLKGAK